MDDRRIGTTLRSLRIRHSWRQEDLSAAAGVSVRTVQRIEGGRAEGVQLETLRSVARALDAWVDVAVRWRGGELDRLLNVRHSLMHERVALLLAESGGWEIVPEASFSIYGERGAIDILAWHAERRILLVIELKTEIVDVQDLVGRVDRKRRLAPQIARERGWLPDVVAVWVVVAEGRTNRRRVAAHRTMLGAAFPDDGRRVHGWLRAPAGPISALSLLPDPPGAPQRLATPKRVRRTATRGNLAKRDTRRT
jgi:transcriptional regulator with XRE-family HTH domain